MNAYLKKQNNNQNKNIIRNRVVFLVFIIFFGVLYLWQVNKLSSKGYEISKLENKIAEIESENEKINVEISNFTSMDSLKKRLESKKMMAINDIKYISVIDNSIAQR